MTRGEGGWLFLPSAGLSPAILRQLAWRTSPSPRRDRRTPTPCPERHQGRECERARLSPRAPGAARARDVPADSMTAFPLQSPRTRAREHTIDIGRVSSPGTVAYQIPTPRPQRGVRNRRPSRHHRAASARRCVARSTPARRARSDQPGRQFGRARRRRPRPCRLGDRRAGGHVDHCRHPRCRPIADYVPDPAPGCDFETDGPPHSS